MDPQVKELVIIDTDILIDVGTGDREALAAIKELRHKRTVAVSAITKMELVVGCRNKTEQRKLERFLADYQVIHPVTAISETAVGLLKQYHLSHNLRMPDSLIAATALQCDCELASKNQKDYRYIPGLKLLPYPIAALA